MVSVPIFDIEGKNLGQKDLQDDFVKGKISNQAMKEAVVAYLTHCRSGNASTKTRAEVSGSNRKPWKQKGTGRARSGERTSPVWRGGGITFGPKPHEYHFKLNRQVVRLARESALRIRLQEGNIVLIKELKVEEPRTVLAAQIVKNLKLKGKSLIVVKEHEAKLKLAFRNLPTTRLIRLAELNAYTILTCQTLVFTEEAFNVLNIGNEAAS